MHLSYCTCLALFCFLFRDPLVLALSYWGLLYHSFPSWSVSKKKVSYTLKRVARHDISILMKCVTSNGSWKTASGVTVMLRMVYHHFSYLFRTIHMIGAQCYTAICTQYEDPLLLLGVGVVWCESILLHL